MSPLGTPTVVGTLWVGTSWVGTLSDVTLLVHSSLQSALLD